MVVVRLYCDNNYMNNNVPQGQKVNQDHYLITQIQQNFFIFIAFDDTFKTDSFTHLF